MNVGNASRNGNRPKMLLEVAIDTIRRKHYSYRTEKSYLQWIKCYVTYP